MTLDTEVSPEILSPEYYADHSRNFMRKIFSGPRFDQIDELDLDHLKYAANVLAEVYIGFDQPHKPQEQIVDEAAMIWQRLNGYNPYQISQNFNLNGVAEATSKLNYLARVFSISLPKSELTQLLGNLIEVPFEKLSEAAQSVGPLAVRQALEEKDNSPESTSKVKKTRQEFYKSNDSGAGEDLVRMYLDEIGTIPLLTKDDEVKLAQAIEKGIAANELLKLDDHLSSIRRRQLHRESLQGEEAHRQFVNSNLRLVVSIAKKYQSSGLPLLDLIQEGNLGLIHAVDKFDWQKGFKFSTYATWWVRQSIQRGISNTDRIIRLPVHAHDKIAKIKKASNSLVENLGREPTIYEIANLLELEADQVADMLGYARETASLNEPISDEGPTELGENVEDHDAIASLNDALTTLDMKDVVPKMLDVLDERERQILVLRFGIDGCGERELSEIAEVLHTTRQNINQLMNRAFDKLRHPSNDVGAQEILT